MPFIAIPRSGEITSVTIKSQTGFQSQNISELSIADADEANKAQDCICLKIKRESNNFFKLRQFFIECRKSERDKQAE